MIKRCPKRRPKERKGALDSDGRIQVQLSESVKAQNGIILFRNNRRITSVVEAENKWKYNQQKAQGSPRQSWTFILEEIEKCLRIQNIE